MTPDPFDLTAFKRPPRPAQPGPVAVPGTPPDTSNDPSPHPPIPGGTPARARPRPRRAPRTPGPASDGRLVLALPVPLRDRARTVAAGRGETYADVVLRAVQHTHARLPDLIEDRRHHDAGATIGPLFEHRTHRRRTTEATAQVTIRGLSAHDRAVLDRLVDDVGAANLTELVTVALEADLPTRPRAMR